MNPAQNEPDNASPFTHFHNNLYGYEKLSFSRFVSIHFFFM